MCGPVGARQGWAGTHRSTPGELARRNNRWFTVSTVAGDIRYRKGADNSVLKLALYDEYRTRCYSCGVPQSDYAAVQIDHIVPETTSPADIGKWVPASRVQGYDLDAPYNLAPICPPCNLKKLNRDLSGFPVLASALHRAWSKQSAVIRRAKFFQGPTTIAKFLKTIATMDFDDPDSKAVFEEHMPALVRRLAAINPSKAHDFDELRTVWIGDPTRGTQEPVSVTLGFSARASVTILENVCRVSLDDALQQPMMELRDAVIDRAHGVLNAYEFQDRNEEADVSTPDGDVDIHVDELRVSIDGTYFWFTFSGQLDASLSAFLAVASVDAETTDYIQGDVFVNGRFSVGAGWEFEDTECVEVIIDNTDDWTCDTEVH